MQILVAGSNKDGNDREKERAIAILKKAGHEVFHSRDIYRSADSPQEGNEAVERVLRDSQVLYVVCSVDGHVGENTIFRMGYAASINHFKIFSSQAITNPDLKDYMPEILTGICSPKELVEYLDLLDHSVLEMNKRTPGEKGRKWRIY